jgi:hypothetical protein
VRLLLRLAGFAACCAAGLALAGIAVGGVADVTVTETTTVPSTVIETHALTQTVTSSATETQVSTETTTVVSTSVETTTETQTTAPTTTSIPETTAPTTSAETTSSSSSGTPAWVWVLVGLLAAGVGTLAVLLARRDKGVISVEDRQRRVDATVATWVGQGWALESETSGSAVLVRRGERMLVDVDAAGHVTVRPQQTDPSDWPTRAS